MRTGAFVRVLVGALLIATTSAARAAELTDARVKQEQLQEQLQATVDELSALQTRAAEFEARRDELATQLSGLQAQLSGTQARVDERIRRLYSHGVASPAVMVLAAQSPTEAMERAAFAARLLRDDRATMEQAASQRRQVEAVAGRLAHEQRALDAATHRQQEVSRQLQQRLEEAAVTVAQLEEEQRLEEARRLEEGRRLEEARRLEEQRLEEQRRLDEQRAREEAERRRVNEQQRQRNQPLGPRPVREATRVPPPPVVRPKPPPPPRPGPGGGGGSDGDYSCPVVRPRAFSNDWGAPRSGGRRHQGTDIFAPHGANVVAIVDGVVNQRGYGESAGWWLILRGDDGSHYWYMHLQRYSIANGARVSAGQLIAQNGDTGNAKGTSPHVHFEHHPGGGGAVNPYPLLRRVCG